MRTSGGEVVRARINFWPQLVEQIEPMKLLMAPDRQNLPPLQPHAIKQPATPAVKKLIDPAITFRLPSKLVNAENSSSQAVTPLLVDKGTRETEIDDQVPARAAPCAVVGRIFGMEQENFHTTVNGIPAEPSSPLGGDHQVPSERGAPFDVARCMPANNLR